MRIIITALAMLALAACAPSQTRPSAAAIDREVRAAEAAWTAAVIAKDRAALTALMASDFTLSFDEAPGEAVPRDAWLANLDRMVISDYVVEVREVTPTAEGALARVGGRWTVSMGGPPVSESFVLTDRWARRDGRWQVVNRHRLQ